jgi:serine/threonine protein kinase
MFISLSHSFPASRLAGGTVLDRIVSSDHFSEKVDKNHLNHAQFFLIAHSFHICYSRAISDSISFPQQSATVMVDVLHAIQYLHEIGLVHRDIKARTAPMHNPNNQPSGGNTSKSPSSIPRTNR